MRSWPAPLPLSPEKINKLRPALAGPAISAAETIENFRVETTPLMVERVSCRLPSWREQATNPVVGG
jgi:hypothetical protein